MFTLGFVFLFTYHDGAREFAMRNVWIAITAIIVGLATIIAISCCESVRHTSPHNFIVLAIFTIAEGYVVGMSTMHAQPEVVNTILKKLFQLNQLNLGLKCNIFAHKLFAGIAGCRINCYRCHRPYHFCCSNKMGFYDDGRHIICVSHFAGCHQFYSWIHIIR